MYPLILFFFFILVTRDVYIRGLLEKYLNFFFLNPVDFNEACLHEVTLKLHMHT